MISLILEIYKFQTHRTRWLAKGWGLAGVRKQQGVGQRVNISSDRYTNSTDLSVLSHLSATPETVAIQAPLFMGILQVRIQEWVECLPPGDLPNPGIQPSLPHCKWILYLLIYQGGLKLVIIVNNTT